MNSQISDYNAVYTGTPGACAPCQQAKMPSSNKAMTIQMPGNIKSSMSGTSGQSMAMDGTAQSIPQQGAGSSIPSAIQQPGIQSAVMGTGASMQQMTPATTQLSPVTEATQSTQMGADGLEFLNGFLRTQVGKRVKIEFLIGTNTFTDKSGVLLGVGANYIIIREASTDDFLTCDFFNIKFVTIYN